MPLYDFSCYSSESFLQTIKNVVLSKRLMLEQAVKRIDEQHRNSFKATSVEEHKPFAVVSYPHSAGPTLHPLTWTQFGRVVIWEKFEFICNNVGNSIVFMKNREIFCIDNILKTPTGNVLLLGRTFDCLSDFFDFPTQSFKLHGFLASNLNPVLRYRRAENVLWKECRLPVNVPDNGTYYISPLSLHHH